MTLPRGDGEVVSSTRVAVRVRPMTSIERDLGAGRCLNIRGATGCAATRGRGTPSDFTFDHAWELDETQEEVYAAIGEPALRAAWDGYDVGVMAYGQTRALARRSPSGATTEAGTTEAGSTTSLSTTMRASSRG